MALRWRSQRVRPVTDGVTDDTSEHCCTIWLLFPCTIAVVWNELRLLQHMQEELYDFRIRGVIPLPCVEYSMQSTI